MTDKTQTQEHEPTPRPPRQPDLALITYLERSDDTEEKAGEPEAGEPR